MNILPVLTVTLNSAIDVVILIDQFTPGIPMNAQKVISCVGGKGCDTSVALNGLGVPTTAILPVAGKLGIELIKQIENYGIQTVPIWVEGETRVLFVISDLGSNQVSHIKHGELVVTNEALNEFKIQYSKHLAASSWVVIAGSISASITPGFLKDLLQLVSCSGKPILIDVAGNAMCDALPYHPTIVKMNWNEFDHTFNVTTPNLNELARQAKSVSKMWNLSTLVITCAEQGILAMQQNDLFHVAQPIQKAINAAGAGDAVSAGLVWRLLEGDPFPTALKWAGAAAAASVLTERTAELKMSDVLRIFPEVMVKRI